MEEKISQKAIEQYSQRYAGKLTDSFFGKKDCITGAEILTISKVQQINFFILAELFGSWKSEASRLQSSFFDYTAQEVKQSLDHLMIVLSNHISVKRDDFEKLARKATVKTLKVLLAPYDFFSEAVEGEDNTLVVADFEETLKYLKINKAPLVRLLEDLKKRNLEKIAGTEAFAMLDHILEEVNFTPEDFDGFSELLSATESLKIESLYESSKAKKSDKKITINEKHGDESRRTVVEDFQKIPRIKDRLTINQKFMFTKVLFQSDFESFSQAVDTIDQQENIGAALKFLSEHEKNWDKNSEEYQEFLELVEKRFS